MHLHGLYGSVNGRGVHRGVVGLGAVFAIRDRSRSEGDSEGFL